MTCPIWLEPKIAAGLKLPELSAYSNDMADSLTGSSAAGNVDKRLVEARKIRCMVAVALHTCLPCFWRVCFRGSL